MISKISSEHRPVTVLVASLNKFSYHNLNEAVSERAIDLLDAFFQTMLPVIDASGGTVIDLAGHHLLTSYELSDDTSSKDYTDEASRQSSKAVEAAFKMQQVFALMKPGWAECGFEVEMGIGIHHGIVTHEHEENCQYKLEVIKGSVVDVAHCLSEQSGNILVSETIFQDISLLEGKMFQASKLWVSAVQDGTVAYQLTAQPSVPEMLYPAAGEYQILIAEDHADLRDIFATVLRRAGFSVNVAQNGHEAMEYLNRTLPDLLLLDINMPGPSGLEIIRHVRQSQKPLHVIVITANYQAGRSAEADMADVFLLKPVSITDLVQFAHRFVKVRV